MEPKHERVHLLIRPFPSEARCHPVDLFDKSFRTEVAYILATPLALQEGQLVADEVRDKDRRNDGGDGFWGPLLRHSLYHEALDIVPQQPMQLVGLGRVGEGREADEHLTSIEQTS